MDDRYFVGAYKGTVRDGEDDAVYDDFITTDSESEAYEYALRKNLKGFSVTIEDGVEDAIETYKPYSMGKQTELVDEAMAAPLLNVKNQLMKVLSDTFEFIGGSTVPKFTMKSKEEPDVSFDVTMTGNNVDVTPKYNDMPDTAHKKRGIALMRAANVIVDFVNSVMGSYKPAYAESVKKLRIREDFGNNSLQKMSQRQMQIFDFITTDNAFSTKVNSLLSDIKKGRKENKISSWFYLIYDACHLHGFGLYPGERNILASNLMRYYGL